MSPSKWTISPSSVVLIGSAAPWLIVLARVEAVLIRHEKLGTDEVISDDLGNYVEVASKGTPSSICLYHIYYCTYYGITTVIHSTVFISMNIHHEIPPE